MAVGLPRDIERPLGCYSKSQGFVRLTTGQKGCGDTIRALFRNLDLPEGVE